MENDDNGVDEGTNDEGEDDSDENTESDDESDTGGGLGADQEFGDQLSNLSYTANETLPTTSPQPWPKSLPSDSP